MRKLSLSEIRNGKSSDGRNLHLSPFIYSLNVTSITAGGSASDVINIENDSQFVWVKTTCFADIAGAAQTESSRVIPLVTLQIKDGGSARDFFDEPQPLGNMSGFGELPHILPAPFVFSNNANVIGSFTNYSNATTYENLYVSLIGYRVYEYGNSLI